MFLGTIYASATVLVRELNVKTLSVVEVPPARTKNEAGAPHEVYKLPN